MILAVCGWILMRFFSLFESYLKCKSNKVRNRKISLQEFKKNLKMCLKNGICRRIDLNLRTSYRQPFILILKREKKAWVNKTAQGVFEFSFHFQDVAHVYKIE